MTRRPAADPQPSPIDTSRDQKTAGLRAEASAAPTEARSPPAPVEAVREPRVIHADGNSRHRPLAGLLVGDRYRMRPPPPQVFSPEMVLTAKLALVCAVLAGLHCGPPYYACRLLKEQGMFFYGTTVQSCMQERIDARTNPLEGIARRLPTL